MQQCNELCSGGLWSMSAICASSPTRNFAFRHRRRVFASLTFCVLSVSAPREQVIQTPPVAVIEILSPEDRVSRYLDRLEDYRKMGVRNVWVIDPATRRGFDFSSGSWIATASFADAATGLRLDLAALFASIDDALGDPVKR